MFAYEPDWTDAAVRRFLRRVGADLLDDLFALRAADNAASGVARAGAAGLDASCASASRRSAAQAADPRRAARDRRATT